MTRTELSMNDTVTVSVTAALNQPGNAESAILDLGVPPGFTPETADLSALISRYQDYPEDYEFATIERFELTRSPDHSIRQQSERSSPA